MSDKTITTTDELLALRDEAGIIRHEGGLRIECDVPYSVGSRISRLYVDGNLYVRGILYVGDSPAPEWVAEVRKERAEVGA